MSDLQLEQAAIAPHRWIKLCTEFARQHPDPDYSGATLCPKTTRIIQHPLGGPELSVLSTQVFLVPGGRYLVSYSPLGICVWDLGYTSNADFKLLASVGPEGGTESCMVSTTSDGIGLIIVAFRR